MPKLKDRVLGFAFNQARTHVLLLKASTDKRHPGRLDAPGGEADFNEALVGATSRAFQEQTGIYVPPEAWKVFAFLSGVTSETRCLMVEIADPAEKRPEAEWISVEDASLRTNGAPNLRWLIPMALCDEGLRSAHITYRG